MGFLQPTISRIHIVLKLIINNILYRKLQVSHRSLRSYTQHVNLKYLLSKHLVVNTLHEEEWWRAMFNCRMLTGENADLFKAELFHVGSKRQRNMNTTFILQSNLWQTIFKWNEVRLYSATVCVCVFTLTEFWSTVTGNTLVGMELRNKRKFSWIDVSAQEQRWTLFTAINKRQKIT